MYTNEYKFRGCDHNHRDRKGTMIIRHGIVWLLTILTVLYTTGCEEPSSTSSPLGSGYNRFNFSGSTRVLLQITRADNPVGLSNPVIGVDGTVYIATGKALYVIDVDGTGKRQFVLPDAITTMITTAPAVGSDGTVYIATGKTLYVIDAEGKLKSTLDLSGTITEDITHAPAVGSDGTVYIASGNTLYAIDADGNITEKWKHETTEAVISSPAVGADGTVYIASGKTLYAIDAEGTEKERPFDLPDTTITEAITRSPVVDADGVIYIASGKTLYAIDAEGTKRQFDISDTITTSPAISRDAVVYVGSYDGNLYAIDVDVARKKYRTGGAVVSSPAVGADGTIYVGSDDGNLYAIDGEGRYLWAYVTKGPVRSSPAVGVDGTIYVGSDDSKLYAIAGDGTKKWAYSTRGAVRSSPAIGADGTIYVGSDDSNLYAIAGDGTKLWAYKTKGQVRSSPAIGRVGSEERIYIGSNDHYLYAIDTEGETLWKQNLRGAVVSSPALGEEGEVYVGGSDGFVYAFNANGTQRWGYRVGTAVTSSPAIMVDDKGVSTIIIGYRQGLHAIDGESGINQWTKDTLGAVRSSPAIGADGIIYVGAENGNFYTLKSDTGEIENGKGKGEYIGGVGLSSPVIGDKQVIVGTQRGTVYVIESDAIGYAESPWPGRGHDRQHSGRSVSVKGFERYDLQAPTLADRPMSKHYNRFKVLLSYSTIMAGNNKVGAPLSVNDVALTLYYSTTSAFTATPTHEELISEVTTSDDNTPDKGRVTTRILTTITMNTIETPALLRENTQYYYMIQATQVHEPKQTRYSNIIQVETPYEPTLPGMATSLTADTTEKRELTFKADIPDHFGKKSDGITPIVADEVKYWLYYARVGYSTITHGTTAVDVKDAVGGVTGAGDENVGRIESVGDDTLDTVEFLLDNLIGGVQYRYTIITMHRDDVSKQSTPAPAETATVQSEATASGMVTIQVPDTTVKGQVTFHATAPTAGNFGTKADGRTPVDADEVKYWLYYARVGYSTITHGSTAAEVARAFGTATDAGRIERTNTNLSTGFMLTGLTGGAQYQYTIVVVHPDGDAFNSTLTSTETATVESKASTPGMVIGLMADTTTERQLTFRADPPSNRGTKADGITPVDADEVRYWLYYAKVDKTINSIAVTDTTNAAAVVQAVGKVTGASNKNAGRIERVGSTLGTGFVLTGLTGGVQYRYTIVSVHPYDSFKRSALALARTATVQSEATAPGVITNPDVQQSGGIVTIKATAPSNRGKQADGTTDVGEEDIIYRLYYARVGYIPTGKARVTTSTDADVVVKAVGTTTPSNSDVGKIKITGNTNLKKGFALTKLTRGAQYRYTIVSVHPEDDALRAASAPKTMTFEKLIQSALRINTPRHTQWGTAIQLRLAENGSGDGAVTYERVRGTATARVTSSGRVTASSPGTVEVRVIKAENTLYKARTSPTVTVTFTKQTQSALRINTPSPRPWGTIQLSLAENGSGSGAVTYRKVRGTARVTSGGRVTASGPGTVVVRATKAGNTQYKARTSSTVTVTFTKKASSRPSAPSIIIKTCNKGLSGFAEITCRTERVRSRNRSWRSSYTISGYNSRYDYRIYPARAGVSISRNKISSTNAMSNIRVQRRVKETPTYKASSWSSSSNAVNFVTKIRGSVIRIQDRGSSDGGNEMEIKGSIGLYMHSDNAGTTHTSYPYGHMWSHGSTNIYLGGAKTYNSGEQAVTYTISHSSKYDNYQLFVVSNLKEDDDWPNADDDLGTERSQWSLSSILSEIRGSSDKKITKTQNTSGDGVSLQITVEFELM